MHAGHKIQASLRLGGTPIFRHLTVLFAYRSGIHLSPFDAYRILKYQKIERYPRIECGACASRSMSGLVAKSATKTIV